MLLEVLVVIFSLVTPILSTSTLVSVVQVFRHGQRTPYAHYPNDPYSDSAYWPVSRGQLTNVGKTQHYRLGQYTRERYSNFLPEAYSEKFFSAQTTDIDRTHMSAQCNLLGLFPPTATELWNPDIAWSPIPVHPSNPTVMNLWCPAKNREQNRVLKNEPYFQHIDKTYAETYEYLTKYSGVNVTSVNDVAIIYDCLFIENEFGYTLPAWSDAVFPEPLATLSGYSFQLSGYGTKLARLSSGAFLNEVIEHFEKMKENPSGELFRMYSAHDSNIAAILSGLRSFKPHSPYFASTIYFELWRSFLGSYYVNIYYKQRDVVEKITPPGCLQFDCNLENLRNHLSDVLIDSVTLEKECV
ncbi:prostatic acid phosphatase [Leptinotarsa decemlineata]|uniref:prostatic acid phosphatase n=1 Tax=Leptinotarsa decemlineata TaxID=7539 RepID=UPI003D309933